MSIIMNGYTSGRYEPPLDNYPAARGYSVRLLRTDYVGSCLRVQRASDNATQDIGFDSNGNLDTASIVAFCGASIGRCITWYDQGVDASNLTAPFANAPEIYNGVSINLENSKPCLVASGSQYMETVNTPDFLYQAADYSYSHVCRVDNAPSTRACIFATILFSLTQRGIYARYDDISLTDGYIVFVPNGVSSNLASFTATSNNSFPRNKQNLMFVNADLNNLVASERFIYQLDNNTPLMDNTELNSPSQISSSGNFRLFMDSGSFNAMTGNFQELILWNSDQSGNTSTLQSNINDYFAIY